MQGVFKVSVHDFVLPLTGVTRPRQVDVVLQTGDDPSGQPGGCLLDGREDRVVVVLFFCILFFVVCVSYTAYPARGAAQHFPVEG